MRRREKALLYIKTMMYEVGTSQVRGRTSMTSAVLVSANESSLTHSVSKTPLAIPIHVYVPWSVPTGNGRPLARIGCPEEHAGTRCETWRT